MDKFLPFKIAIMIGCASLVLVAFADHSQTIHPKSACISKTKHEMENSWTKIHDKQGSHQCLYRVRGVHE
ncbi:hypothetical protein [Legionella jordanis]|uniref:Secreted protein n=1 Tax=Legionella jordanis TaxID=456 RepID=A0A0W0VBN7_9GAMM|nr:hypothetical protein [Legionella jordanis]KTD17548.1 hypothetical protein Ljor_1854 [Legionella jordanis]VEH13517.1 Uncharacterised protein [Legionella jordanis]